MTEKIRVGVVVTDVITHHPAVLAQTALTLDHVTQGRAILGLGSGEQLNVGPYGMEWSKPVGHLDEALDVIRLLWNAEGAVDFDGRVLPAEGRRARALAVHARAGRRSGSPRTSRGCSGSPGARATAGCRRRCTRTSTARRSRGSAGRPVGRRAGRRRGHARDARLRDRRARTRRRSSASRSTRSCACSASCCRRRTSRSSASSRRSARTGSGFHDFLPTRVPREEALRLAEAIPPRTLDYYAFCGTPDEIVEQFAEFHAQGLRHPILWNITAVRRPLARRASRSRR